MRNSTNIFLVNLSIADLCVLVICTPTVLIEVNSGPEVWPLGEHMCKSEPIIRKSMTHFSVPIPIISATWHKHDAMICLPTNRHLSTSQKYRISYISSMDRKRGSTSSLFLSNLRGSLTNMRISVAKVRMDQFSPRKPTGISVHYHTNVNTTSVDRSFFFKMLVCTKRASLKG